MQKFKLKVLKMRAKRKEHGDIFQREFFLRFDKLYYK